MGDVQDDERAERIAAAFALLTAKLEDAAGLAADGQAGRRHEELQILAQQIADLANEAGVIAGALSALLPATGEEPAA